MGTSTSRDSTPDLSLLKGHLDVTWQNIGTNLGSDQDIISLTIRGPMFTEQVGQARITDRDRLRKNTTDNENPEPTSETPPRTYQAWAKEHLELVENIPKR
ncbi:hypothetical protein HPB48_009980 [Haemaphysalis longicornis]|uniref:Uncharacterized protein n=1 Tax=Haemaphysalis longicornis TaxID=44386 RepID=A0A9J6FZ27_HAELO|nr:hypothetical protein HPB48_009980 [Haemaphysalis longicornis]